MNNAALNTFELNGELLDFAQRSVVIADVVAQIFFDPHVYRSADISGGGVSAQASMLVAGRAFVRGGVGIEPEASIGYFPRSYATAPVAINPGAVATFDGTAYARSLVQVPMVWAPEAAIALSPRIRAGLDASITPQASVSASYRTFAQARAPIHIDSSVDVWVSVDVLRRLPYLEDAVDERSLIVPADDRTVVVI